MTPSTPEAESEGTSRDTALSITWPWLPSIGSDVAESAVSGEAELRWHSKAEALTIGDMEVEDPFVYSSDGTSSVPESSCINTELPIETEDFTAMTELGYWPQYADLSATQRGYYLHWLATERKEALSDDGYLFLFLFGLERRILVDGAEPELILRELLNLLKRYAKSEAFYNTASHFMAFVFSTVKISRIRKNWFQRLFVKPVNKLHDDSLLVALTWLYQHEEPMPAEIAYQVALQDIRCHDSVILRESGKAFRALFIERYTEIYPEGIPLEQTEKTRVFSYQPLNPSLQGWRTAETFQSVTLPDVLGEAHQFNSIVELWNTCLEELRPTISQHDVDNWDSWNALVVSQADARGRVCTSIETIIDSLGIQSAYHRSLSMQQSLDLISVAYAARLSIEPHPDAIFRPYRLDDSVVLVPVYDERNDEAENHYLASELLLTLGIGMAVSDGTIDRVELLHLPAIVNAQFHFGDDDRRRIMAYSHLILDAPAELVPIASRLARVLTPEELSELGEFLIGIAASNGIIEASEMNALKALYKAFRLSDEDLHTQMIYLKLDRPDNDAGSIEVDEDTLDALWSELESTASKVGEVYKRIRSARECSDESVKPKFTLPKPGTSSLKNDSEFELAHQFEHYDDDQEGTHYTLNTASAKEST